MNSKYCKLIRKIAKSYGLSPKMAKNVKKKFLKYGITTPDSGLVMDVMDEVRRLIDEKKN